MIDAFSYLLQQEDQTKNTEMREREELSLIVRQRESTKKCFFVVSPFFKTTPQNDEKRGLSPSLAASFSGNSAFLMAQASGSAF